MTAYILIYLFCSLGFVFEKINKRYSDFLFILIFIYLLILVGLKFEVGGDWINYLNIHSDINQKIFDPYINENYDIFFKTEPIVLLLYIISPNIFIFNFICAFVFLIGLFLFVSKFQDRFLALAVSIPFLITLVALGYQKQSVAIGLMMIVYYLYLNNEYKLFIIFCFITIFSHYSAFFLILFIFYDLLIVKKFNISFALIFLIFFFVITFILFSYDYVFRILMNNYIYEQNRPDSHGLIPRLTIQFLSIFLYFISFKFWKKNILLNRIIIFNIFLSFIVLPFVTLYSTSIDRMLFYFMLIQRMILGNYREILVLKKYILYRFSIFIFYLFITLLWFNFSYFAAYWVPYNNILFPDLS